MIIVVNHGWLPWLLSRLAHLMWFSSGNVDFHVAQNVVKNDLLPSGYIFW